MTLPLPGPDDGTAWTPERARVAVVGIAVLAGLLAASAGVAPTGQPTVDAWIVAVAVGGVTWLGAAAMRWDAALATLLAALTSWSAVGLLVGVTAAVVGFAVPLRPAHRSLVTAALVGVAMNIAARSQLEWFLGASTLVAVALAAYVAVIGFLRRPVVNRHVVVALAGTAAVVAVIGTCTLGILAWVSAGDLRDGNTFARDGLDHLRDGDLDLARDAFDRAAVAFARADRRLDSAFVAPARYLPGIAQHHRAAVELGDRAADASARLSAELAKVDLDALSLSGGRVDIGQVRALEDPLHAIDEQIDALEATIDDVDSPWLVPPVGDRLDALADAVDEQQQRTDDAIAAAVAAPGLLGADEPRTYFIGFTTPAEARGNGGFMGNWAEVTVTDGAIALTGFGRSTDLNDAGTSDRRFPRDDFDQWLTRYGPYHLSSGPGGTTGPEVWKNINMSPDTVTTGRAIAELYPQSGGGELDGVFVVDVYTLARLLEFTGPIELPGDADGPSIVTADSAVEFLLDDQYDTIRDERIDLLEQFARTVIDTLLAGTLPPPTELADLMAPMVHEGRLTGWAARADEQALLEQIGMAGTLPDAATVDDAVAVAFNNASGSKIDAYLDADVDYRVDVDGDANTATGALEVRMTNNAPTDGEPLVVIGSAIGLDIGDNRTWVSVFTRLPVRDVRLDGRPVETEVGAEAGYFVTSAFVQLPAGATGVLTMSLDGPLDAADGYELAVRTPPTVSPTPMTIDASWTRNGHARTTSATFADPGLHRLDVGPSPSSR